MKLLLLGITLLAGISYIMMPVSVAAQKNSDELLVIPPLENHSQAISSLPEYVVIQPTNQVTFSGETNASVAAIYVKEGSSFQAGDILLELDCRVQNADLKKANAQKSAAKVAYESAKKLKNYGSISNLEYLQAEAQNHMADADVDKLTAIVDKCTIKAPFNGAVAKLNIHLHETVKPGDPLLKIVSIDDLDFVIQIPSVWLAWLRVGTEFDVHVNELNKNVKVKVFKINPEIDSVSQTVKLIGKEASDIHDSSLLPGMSGQAIFPDNPEPKSK